eukprot:6446855-Pyramimonas_sp.AAC.1
MTSWRGLAMEGRRGLARAMARATPSARARAPLLTRGAQSHPGVQAGQNLTIHGSCKCLENKIEALQPGIQGRIDSQC